MLDEKIKFGNAIPASNKAMRSFFLKLIALVVIWECSYHFILEPARIPDQFLTDVITRGVTLCINLFFRVSPHVTWADYPSYSAAFILQDGKTLFLIADFCNGLDLIIIYLGFIILLPYAASRKIIFGVSGIVVITIADIIRCTLLYWIWKYHRSMFDFNHKYLFSILMYLLIFSGWVLFIKKGRKI